MIPRSTALLPKRWRIASRYRRLVNLELGKTLPFEILLTGGAKSANTWRQSMLSRAYQVRFDLAQDPTLEADELANADPPIPRFCVANGHMNCERVVQDRESPRGRCGKAQGYRDDFTPAQLEPLDALLEEALSPSPGYGTTPASAEPAVEANA